MAEFLLAERISDGPASLTPNEQMRLQHLLDKQDDGEALTEAERREAEGLVDLAEALTLRQLRAGS